MIRSRLVEIYSSMSDQLLLEVRQMLPERSEGTSERSVATRQGVAFSIHRHENLPDTIYRQCFPVFFQLGSHDDKVLNTGERPVDIFLIGLASDELQNDWTKFMAVPSIAWDISKIEVVDYWYFNEENHRLETLGQGKFYIYHLPQPAPTRTIRRYYQDGEVYEDIGLDEYSPGTDAGYILEY